uniref:Uncharacterized protein n=1 Tax=Anopheles dirus TaxID=7168 RepID=A0A182NYQ7_9DIPT
MGMHFKVESCKCGPGNCVQLLSTSVSVAAAGATPCRVSDKARTSAASG